jgi:hypothetical protein
VKRVDLYPKKRAYTGLIIVVLALVLTPNANAYFVRPFTQIDGGGLIDGLIENGAPSASHHFGTEYQSTVNLADGTVKSYLDYQGPAAFSQVGGSFGERLTFSNAQGTNIDFSFAFDGIINASPVLPGSGQPLTMIVSSTLYVHDPGTGATWQNFNTIGGELIGESSFDQSLGDPPGDFINKPFADILSGSLAVGTQDTFDVFASLSLLVSTQDPTHVTMDFLNTATFGVQTDPGVNFNSASGVFLTGATSTPLQVPVPGAMALVTMGLLGLRVIPRRQTNA